MLVLYCERVGSGLWSEPVNASSNIVFFLVAWAIWGSAHRVRRLSAGTWLLLALIATIGIGSSLFHTFATTWARVLDVVPILLFQLSYVWLYSREIIGMRRGRACGLLAGFLLAAYLGRQFPHVLNGSLFYAPALFLVLALGLYHHRTQRHQRLDLLVAAGVFFVAAVFRTLDKALCPSFPVGTHFVWHLLLPVVLYLLMRGLLLNAPSTSRAV